MKLINKLTINVKDNSVILEGPDNDVLISRNLPKFHYYQNEVEDTIDITINFSISKPNLDNFGYMKGIPDDLCGNPINFENESVDFEKIRSVFYEAINPPYNEDKMNEFINLGDNSIDDIFEYKKSLFAYALQDSNLSNKRYRWLKDSKLKFLNSRNRKDK